MSSALPPLSGNVSDLILPRLLMSLYRQRATGELVLRTPEMEKKVFFKKGQAIFASSTVPDDRLGEMLVKAGKINMEQYDRSVELLKKTGKRQGAILVESGFISPKDLFWGVKYQVREIIYSLFALDRGVYEFAEGPTSNEIITLRMSMGNLIYEGVKRMEDWTRIRRELPPAGACLKLSDDPVSLFQEVEFSQKDRKILSLVDGVRTIKKVIEDSWLNSFEAMKILYTMWVIGIVTEKKVPEEGVPVEEIFVEKPEADETLLRRINELYGKIGASGPEEVLGVGAGAGLEEIKKSYFRLAREFHPDRLFDSDDQALKDKLSAVFDAVTDAYNALKEEVVLRREEEEDIFFKGLLDEDAGPAGAQQTGPETGRAPALAEQKYRQGIAALKENDASGAAAALREAVKLAPGNSEYWSALALALSRTKGGFREAEYALRGAINLRPGKAEYYANLGLLYLSAKRTAEAKNQFKKALLLDPANLKARKALRQAGMGS